MSHFWESNLAECLDFELAGLKLSTGVLKLLSRSHNDQGVLETIRICKFSGY